MTDLEKHIRNNRDKLDTESVPSDSWKTISVRSGFKTKRNIPDFLKVAAGISIGLFVAFLLYRQDVRIEKLYTLGDIAPEYERIETEYQQSVNELYQNIKLSRADTVEYQWMLDEITYLDSMNMEYREDIGSYVDSEKVVKSLIDYYEKKIRLLRRLELEINRDEIEEDTGTIM